MKDCGITHVLSVLRLPLDKELFENYEHKVVEVDDVEDENLAEHFPDCNRFIQDGLDAGGGVFVHCAMGKSRSAAVVCAYLINRYDLNVDEALSQVREGRAFCEPNDGFMHQLQLYYNNGNPDEFRESPKYQRWLYMREVDLSTVSCLTYEQRLTEFATDHVLQPGSGSGS